MDRMGWSAVCLGAALGAAACAGGNELEVKAALPAWNDTLTATFTRSVDGGADRTWSLAPAGKKTVKGTSWTRLAGKPSDIPDGGLELWGEKTSDTQVKLAGLDYTGKSSTGIGFPVAATVELDAPLTLNLAPPQGVPQPLNATGTATVAGIPQTISATGTYTLKETGATVQTPMGAVADCSRFETQGTVPLLAGLATVSLAGDLWISKALGLVRADLREPQPSRSVGLLGLAGSHALPDGHGSVEKVALVGKGVSRFDLSTFDAKGVHEADKQTHAKMLLEARWVDDAMAKGTQKPYLQQEFGTMLGVFPSTLEQTSVSFLHPEENGKGYVFWTAFVDQAAKNESVNPMSYRVRATFDPSWSQVRVSARIIYKKAP